MARTIFDITHSATNVLTFSIDQPPNTRPLSYSETDMAEQFRQVWNAAIAADDANPNEDVTHMIVEHNGGRSETIDIRGNAAAITAAATGPTLTLPGVTSLTGGATTGSRSTIVFNFGANTRYPAAAGAQQSETTIVIGGRSVRVTSTAAQAQNAVSVATTVQQSLVANPDITGLFTVTRNNAVVTLTSIENGDLDITAAASIYQSTPQVSTTGNITNGTGDVPNAAGSVVRIRIRSAISDLAVFVPTPIRQLLKIRGGMRPGMGMGSMGGMMSMPGVQPAGMKSVMKPTMGSRGTKARKR